MSDKKTPIYFADLPYPEIQIEKSNPTYGKIMLDNLGSACSEMTAVATYTYNNITVENKDIALAFHKISVVEMHHLHIFSKLAMLLGEDPRLWSHRYDKKVYWSPEYVQYPVNLPDVLYQALEAEESTIMKYERQKNYIKDTYIKQLLERIIKDEEVHVNLFKSYIKEYC